ncbi:MAG: glycosyltransferase family 39 protein [Anaerolineae bacterium]
MARRLLPCFLAFAILVPTLCSQSIWWDEGISLHLAGLSLGDIARDRAANIHPPLYFFVLRVWVALAGRTPFAGRYLSALAVTLLPAVVARFLARRVSRRAGRAAGLLVALAPPFVIYGQEIRAYAFLPLLTLALWSLAWPPCLFSSCCSELRPVETRRAVVRGGLLGFAQAVFLMTHYVGVVAVGTTALVYAGRWLTARGRRRRCVGIEWLVGAATAGLLLMPWLLQVAAAGLTSLTGEAGLANTSATALPAEYLAGLVGIFHSVGLPQALTDPLLTRSSVIVGLLLLLAITLLVRSPKRNATPLMVMLLWGVPLLSVPVIWALSPQSHPRYILPFVLGGWMMAGVLVGLRPLGGVVSKALLAAILGMSLLGLRAYLTDPAYARSDVRSVARYVREAAEGGDVVVVPATDWSLPQYDLGAAKTMMMPSTASDEAIAQLVAGVRPSSHVFALDYGRDALDSRSALRAALTAGGVLVDRVPFHGASLEVYHMYERAALPSCQPYGRACVEGGDLCLVGAGLPESPISGAAMPVRLCWQGTVPDRGTGVALRLYGPGGALVAAHDVALTMEPGDSGQTWSSYAVVPLPVGLLPQAYRLELGLFDPQDASDIVNLVEGDGAVVPALRLGPVTPAAEPWRDESLYIATAPPSGLGVRIAPSLRLEGLSLDRERVAPGQALIVTTLWRVMGEAADPGVLRFSVAQSGLSLVTSDVALPLSDIPTGRPLLTHTALSIPTVARSGPAQVILHSSDEVRVVGAVNVDAVEHRFTAPSYAHETEARFGEIAALLGYDLDPGPVLGAGEPFTLTLIWQAGEQAATVDLKVFTHLVGVDGTMLAQHDSQPGNWSRPTPGWVVGEIIVDPHTLTWLQEDYEGEATFRVGLYEASTGDRVPLHGGGDVYVLQPPLTVEPAP